MASGLSGEVRQEKKGLVAATVARAQAMRVTMALNLGAVIALFIVG